MRRTSPALSLGRDPARGALGFELRDPLAAARPAPGPAAAACRGRGSRAGRSRTGGPSPCGCTSDPPGRARRRIDRACRVPTGHGSHRSSRSMSSTTIGVQPMSPPGPDREPVAAGVVDERDAQCGLDLGRQVARVVLAQDVAPQPPEPLRARAEEPQRRERHGRDVLAPLEVRRVRAGPGEDHRMAVRRRSASGRPSAAAGRRRRSRGRRSRPSAASASASVGRRLEDDIRLLEVGLVVVRAEERRAPVVHGVHEHVVEDDPAVAAHRPDRGRRPADRPGGSPRTAGAAAAAVPPGTRPRTSSEAVKPASTSRANRPTRASRPGAWNRGPVRAAVPAGELEPVHRSWHEPQVALLAGDGAALRRAFEGQPAGRHRRPRRGPPGARAQQVAVGHVGLGRHREEQLAVGVPDDRLEALEQLDVAHACVGPVGASGSPSGRRSPGRSAR